MKSGDVLGHECMGEVVEVGRENKRLKVGDRVVIPFCLACGECRMCRMELYSAASGLTAMGKNKRKRSRLWRSWSARLFAPDRRLRRWASTIRSNPFRGLWRLGGRVAPERNGRIGIGPPKRRARTYGEPGVIPESGGPVGAGSHEDCR